MRHFVPGSHKQACAKPAPPAVMACTDACQSPACRRLRHQLDTAVRRPDAHLHKLEHGSWTKVLASIGSKLGRSCRCFLLRVSWLHAGSSMLFFWRGFMQGFRCLFCATHTSPAHTSDAKCLSFFAPNLSLLSCVQKKGTRHAISLDPTQQMALGAWWAQAQITQTCILHILIEISGRSHVAPQHTTVGRTD